MWFYRCNHKNLQNRWTLEVFWKMLICNFFHLKTNYHLISLVYNRVYSDRTSPSVSNEAIRIGKFHFSRKLWLKNCEKLPKWLRCQKEHTLQVIKDINSKFLYHELKTWVKIVSRFNVPISNTFREISRQRASRSGRFRLVHCIQYFSWS